MRVITFDIETANTFEEAESWDPADLQLAVVCAHDSATGKIEHYLEKDLPELWKLFAEADVLVGWNSDHFDIPHIARRYPGNIARMRSVDMMKEMQKVIGRRIKLDDVAQATLGKGKSADGLQSIVWWREGKVQEVIDYCKQDVQVTRDLFDYALANGHLKYPQNGAGIQEAKLDTSAWLTKAELPQGATPSLFG
jgi:DEAD/DEAH box helicase domain-containing protein